MQCVATGPNISGLCSAVLSSNLELSSTGALSGVMALFTSLHWLASYLNFQKNRVRNEYFVEK